MAFRKLSFEWHPADYDDSCARHPDKVCKLTHFVSSTKKCSNFHLIVSLRGHFDIHNNNKPFSSMSQSQNIKWVKQKPDNNCKATRIVTKSLVPFFSAHPVYVHVIVCVGVYVGAYAHVYVLMHVIVYISVYVRVYVIV